MAGRMRRISPQLISTVDDIKKRHGLHIKFTDATNFIAHILKEQEVRFVERLPESKRRKIQWY